MAGSRPASEISGMLRVWSDFNTRTVDGLNMVLLYKEKELFGQLESLGLAEGDKVVLYQDDDFEVTATLIVRYDDFLKRDVLLASPDFATIIYFDVE